MRRGRGAGTTWWSDGHRHEQRCHHVHECLMG
jgi:hypothetical protein